MQAGNSFFGMDIEAVKGVTTSLESQAGQIESILKTLASALGATPWKGPDHDRFVDEWTNQYAPALTKAAKDIRDATGQMKASIQLQITASGS